MGLKNCKNCGKVFINKYNQLCDQCQQEEEVEYRMVKDYLWENSQATVEQIHQGTGVDKKLIRRFVREGRFNRF